MIGRRLSVIAVLVSLAGCVNGLGPDYAQPEQPQGAGFISADVAYVTANPPPSEWWTSLTDPTLNALVAQAIAANKDIATAKANLRAARAAERGARSDFFPNFNAGASYARARPSAAAEGFSTPFADVNAYDGAFDASWEVDIFGRISRNTEAARADTQAADARLSDVLVSVIADTARGYVDLRGTQERLDVARRNIENQQRSYDLTVDLSEGGRGSQLDVARAKAQLETTLATIASLEAAEASAKFRLAVLTGTPPGGIAQVLNERQGIPMVPAMIAIGDPAAMLRRRPDVRAAERELAAATARIGVATADLFPRVTLSGVVGLSALSAGTITNAAAFQYSAGPSIVWNFLDGGRIRARIQQADALAEARLGRYDATVLAALEDAENALTRFGREQVRFGHLAAAAEASGRAADLAEQRYSAGIDNFLTVLDAQRSLLASEDALVQSRTAATTQFIAIHKALGAGWQ